MTPLLLLVLMGGLVIGLLLIDRSELAHAAQEGAVMGATASAGADRCTEALNAATAVLGRPAGSQACSEDGTTVEVQLTDDLPLPVPFLSRGSWRVAVAERGAIR